MNERRDTSEGLDEREVDDHEGPTFVDEDGDPTPEDERVAELLTHTIDIPILASAVEAQEAPDAADTLENLGDDEAAEVLFAMDTGAAAEALAEMEDPLAASVLEDLIDENRADYAALLVRVMAPDDAADLIQAVDLRYQDRLLAAIPVEERESLRILVEYGEDTAAGLMTTDFLALRENQSVDQATDAIRAAELPEDVTHLPVVDDTDRIVGVVSLRALLLAQLSRPLDELVQRDFRAIRADTDQESVAHEFDRYDFFMLPVVDQDDRLLGIITVDDVIDIIREEHTEDVQRSVGAGAEEAVYSSMVEKFRGRFPWLIVSLVTLVPATLVVVWAKEVIGETPALAIFMPIVAALAGNAGHQALAVTLRGIVLEQVRRDRIAPLIRRETVVGALVGASLGVLIGLIVLGASFVSPDITGRLGVVVGLSMMCSMPMGTLAGTSIPLLMRRFGWDPAQSSAIFLIMITDLVGLATFLGLAGLLRGWMASA